jgi:hypothetical protein
MHVTLPTETEQACKIVLETEVVMKMLPRNDVDFIWDDPTVP